MGPALAFLGAVFFGTAAGASVAYALAVNLARIALLSLVSKALAPKIDLTTAAADKLLTVRSSFQPQAFVYGQDMLSGPLLFANTAGDGNKELHRLIALTGREIEAFLAFRIDDTDIVIGDDIPDDNHIVTGGQFADVVEIGTRLGTDTQTAIPDLVSAFSTNWTSAHQGRGWSLLYTKMILEGNNEAFEAGIPQNIRALVKGHKVYDPRNGLHDVDDPTTWEWSNNPALCLADFLLWQNIGMGEIPDRIDWDLVSTAADICEEQCEVPQTDSDGGTTFQNRYTCNFTFYGDQDRGSIVEILTTAMMGRLVFSQGQWRMWAGAAIPATVTLTEANLSGPITLQASTPSENRYNRVRGKFVDPTRNYTANPYPEIRDASYEAADNEIKYQTFDLNACNDSFEAQRNAIIRLRQSRMQRVLTWSGNWSCFKVQPGTTVEITVAELGFTEAKYFVTEWTLDKEGKGVNLTMIQEDDSVWEDPTEYSIRTPTDLVFAPSTGIRLFGASLINERADAVCHSGVILDNDGKVYYLSNAGMPIEAPTGQWRNGELGSYWARITFGTGDSLDVASNTAGIWYPLTSDVRASVRQSGLGIETAVVTIEIASDATGATILASADFYLSAAVISAELYLISLSPWTFYVPGDAQKDVVMPGYSAGDLLVCLAFTSSTAAPTPVFATPGQWDQIQSASGVFKAWISTAVGGGADEIQTAASPEAGHINAYRVAHFSNPAGLEYNTHVVKSFYNGTTSTSVGLPASGGSVSPGAGNYLVIVCSGLVKANPASPAPAMSPTWIEPYYEGFCESFAPNISGTVRGAIWSFGWAVLTDSNTAVADNTIDTIGESGYGRYGQAIQIRLL